MFEKIEEAEKRAVSKIKVAYHVFTHALAVLGAFYLYKIMVETWYFFKVVL